ncbi:hypothetical protein BCR43DRAFT_501892 [Syncephalastrum racemosum]|uniref:Uncharacterized protein n=1 Tax=Syncephalastrum racemosum TaxID=13706 RepID=A0A1X2HL16_SYNRA|nr:hypothetical protein BCR43DRAFT_501892 [Syncephalastrum racemosum]
MSYITRCTTGLLTIAQGLGAMRSRTNVPRQYSTTFMASGAVEAMQQQQHGCTATVFRCIRKTNPLATILNSQAARSMRLIAWQRQSGSREFPFSIEWKTVPDRIISLLDILIQWLTNPSTCENIDLWLNLWDLSDADIFKHGQRKVEISKCGAAFHIE